MHLLLAGVCVWDVGDIWGVLGEAVAGGAPHHLRKMAGVR